MMQWTKGDTGFETKDEVSAIETTSDERLGTGLLFAQVIQSLAMALSRVGVTSIMLVIMVAVVVATVVFGLTANEAAAIGGWCRKC
jgi:hypothetical protein